jgi:hypothetical protein
MTLKKFAAAACLLLASTPVFAQSAAFGSINHFSYQLIDLAPDDGITPWITVTPRGAFAEVGLFDNPVFDPSGLIHEERYTTGTVELSDQDGSVTATSGVDFTSASTNLAFNSGYADAVTAFDFTLSPNTRVIFSGYATVDANVLPDNGSAYAESGLFGGIFLPSGAEESFSGDLSVFNGVDARTVFGGGDSGADVTTGWVQMQSVTQAASFALPVPEPASAGMLAAGLLLLAGVGRQQGRRALCQH